MHVIPSEARNLSAVKIEEEERFLVAPLLGMTADATVGAQG
jgi:hypothetical protein